MNEYIAQDEISKEILNSAKLLQTVTINALIVGSSGVGKKSLAKFILPKSEIYEAKTLQQDINDKVLNIQNKSIIINQINEITNINLFLQWVEKNNLRVIAISKNNSLNQKLKDFFSLNIEIPDLIKRPNDTKYLIQKFSKEASVILNIQYINIKELIINTTTNAHSLRKYIFFSYLSKTIGEEEILSFLEKFFTKSIEKSSSYKDLLYIFEIPLLKAYTKEYKSQVQVAKHLDLNRITLRKKLDLYKEHLR